MSAIMEKYVWLPVGTHPFDFHCPYHLVLNLASLLFKDFQRSVPLLLVLATTFRNW